LRGVEFRNVGNVRLRSGIEHLKIILKRVDRIVLPARSYTLIARLGSDKE